MHIAMVNSLYFPDQFGGAERSVQALAESLVDRGHIVDVHSLSEHDADTTIHNGVTVHRHRLDNFFWSFDKSRERSRLANLAWHLRDAHNARFGRTVAELLIASQPDLIHTHNLAGFSIALLHHLRLSTIPIVHTARDYYAICLHTNLYAGSICQTACMKCRLNRQHKSLSKTRIDSFVAISRCVLKRHLDAGAVPPAAETRCIYNGVDPPAEKTRSAGSHRPVRSTPVVGYLGTIAPVKGVEDLLRAHRDDGRTYRLRIAGTGNPSLVDYLKSTYHDPTVEFVGRVDSATFFRSIDLLVVPSKWDEPFGRVVIEAYGHGVPVVAYPNGALTEIVEHGRSGWLTSSTNPAALTRTIRQAIDPVDRLMTTGKYAKQKSMAFTTDVMVNRYEDLFRQTIRRVAERQIV